MCLSKAMHLRQVHRYGWTVSVDGDTGAVTIQRRGRVYRRLPPGTHLRRPPPQPAANNSNTPTATATGDHHHDPQQLPLDHDGDLPF